MEAAIKNLHAVGEKVAGVIIEPIQGEAGVIIPPAGYFKKVREICDKYNVALICDEIQTGMGRTGKWWAFEHYGVTPDIMSTAKALQVGAARHVRLRRDRAAVECDLADGKVSAAHADAGLADDYLGWHNSHETPAEYAGMTDWRFGELPELRRRLG